METMSRGQKHYEWEKENAVFVGLKLMKNTDADIIDYLSRHGKQPEIKRLIRQAIEKEKAEQAETPFDF